jgi:hypothetical protein
LPVEATREAMTALVGALHGFSAGNRCFGTLFAEGIFRQGFNFDVLRGKKLKKGI